MAHTCGVCGVYFRLIVAPTIDDSVEVVDKVSKLCRRINRNYRHDIRSWKRATKARKQWARHSWR